MPWPDGAVRSAHSSLCIHSTSLLARRTELQTASLQFMDKLILYVWFFQTGNHFVPPHMFSSFTSCTCTRSVVISCEMIRLTSSISVFISVVATSPLTFRPAPVTTSPLKDGIRIANSSAVEMVAIDHHQVFTVFRVGTDLHLLWTV